MSGGTLFRTEEIRELCLIGTRLNCTVAVVVAAVVVVVVVVQIETPGDYLRGPF